MSKLQANSAQALQCKFTAEMPVFFTRFGVFFNVRCLGTWEQNSSLGNVFGGLLNLQSLSSQGPHKSLDFLLCRFA